DLSVVDFRNRAAFAARAFVCDFLAARIGTAVRRGPSPFDRNVLTVLDRVCNAPFVVGLRARHATHECNDLLRAFAAEILRDVLILCYHCKVMLWCIGIIYI